MVGAEPAQPSVSPSTSPSPEPTTPAGLLLVAQELSHQDDTGFEGQHKYRMCDDIVSRANAVLSLVTTAKTWDVKDAPAVTVNHRSAPIRARAFDVEVAKANASGADVVVVVHVNGGVAAACSPSTCPATRSAPLWHEAS